MIRLFTAAVRITLAAAAMAAAVPMLALAQTTGPATESTPAPAKPMAAQPSPTGNAYGADDGASVQANAPAKPASPAVRAAQRRFDNIRRGLLGDRAGTVDGWLLAITIVIGILAIVSVVGGYIGFRRFRDIEEEARDSVEAVTHLADAAKRHVEAIESHQARSAEILQDMNARIAAHDPKEARRAVQTIRQNPTASPTDKVIARALSLQREDRRDEAVEKWHAVAHVAEESDHDLAARAWFSVGYLTGDKDLEAGISAYDRAIRLKPGYAEAYANRGEVKAALGRHHEAIADYDEAIRLQPGYGEAYGNRGIAKADLGLKDEARKDIEASLELARKAGNPELAAAAQQSLRDLDATEDA